MGMVMVLHQASDNTIDRLLADPPLVWQFLAPDNPEVYTEARRASRGLLTRLLGRRAEVPPLELSEDEGELLDLDKSWHGIHFLLTETAWEGEAPLNFVVGGGTEIAGQDVGYGPARAFRSDEVRIISQALERVSTEELCARFDPDAMRAAEVYPDIWESPSVDDGPLLFLTQHLEDLRGALRTLVARQRGLVVTLS